MGYYDKIAQGYNGLYKEEQRKKLSIIKKNIKINKYTKILDVGCGTGISSDFNCYVVGVDPSIELLRQNANNKILGFAENLPFKDGSFDYVISITSMHNFKNVKKSINEIKRVGKDYFVFSVLKKSKKFGFIQKLIQKSFKVRQVVEEDKDAVFFCQKLKNHKLYI